MNRLVSGIILSPQHWAQMEADVSARQSEEACGIVAGESNFSRLVIPVTNLLHDSHRFRMDPQEELNAFQLVEEKGWDVLAIYHSHPHGISHLSSTDIAELTFPGIVYLIWFQEDRLWQCRGYLMLSAGNTPEVPVSISTKK